MAAGMFALSFVALRRMVEGPAPVIMSLQSADPSIETVQAMAPQVLVVGEIHNVPDIAATIERSGQVVRAVGQALKRGVSDDLRGVDTVHFVFRADGVDRFGHDVMARLMELDIPLTALMSAATADAPPGRLLALARSVKLTSPGAYDALDAWCADRARADRAFCRKANPDAI
jgi:hypothetical protein